MGLSRDIGLLLFDPRGRMSRQDLLAAATVMMFLDLLLASLAAGLALYAIKAIAYWIGGAGIIKRLHDTGRTGWWFLGGAVALCIWSALIGIGMVFILGLEPLQAGAPGYVVMLGLVMLPALGATLWLHLAEGEPGMNRFGPEPAGLSRFLAGHGESREGAASRR
jgi:uncharacterized membrane protein YhaH (DUF805 family)